MSKKNRNSVTITRPCPAEVEKSLREWEVQEDYKAREDALDRLFNDYAPKNEDLEDILIKVSALNDFYSTNIYSVYPVAKHIKKIQNLDKRLAEGDSSIVDKLKKVSFKGKEWKFYSFASKYCSHHNPYSFPIYDAYVEKMLVYFKDLKDINGKSFATFTSKEIKDSYTKFTEVIIQFRDAYGLKNYTLKQIDRYLWITGKKYFPKKYSKAKYNK